MNDKQTQNKSSEKGGQKKDGEQSKRSVSSDLVKIIMGDALERHLALEQTIKDLQVAVSPSINSTTHIAEELGNLISNSPMNQAFKQMSETHKALEQAMAPYTSEFARIAELANTLTPTLSGIGNLEKLSSLPVLEEWGKTQKLIEEQSKTIFQGIDFSALTVPIADSSDVVLFRNPEVFLTPIPRKEPSVTERQYQEGIILASKLAAHEVMQEVKTRASDKYKKDGDIIGINLPENTDWPQLTIKFIDGHTVRINTEDNPTDYFFRTFKEMGFEDGRDNLPNEQWDLLRSLAESHGIITWKSPKANGKVKTRKKLLAKALIYYFDISSDPFESYRREHGYKIKINLLPETGSLGTTNIEEVDKRLEGMGDVFGE
ncbi:MAG: hypothetical protein P4L74_02770 [Candidatus Doudnabacteria bacterium]|nr:hypothetical protein [Candidatus Doudnabacteria bacterium]